MKFLSITALSLIVSLSLSACGATNKNVEKHNFKTDVRGLVIASDRDDPTIIFKRPGAPGLNAYNKFIIDPVQLDYSDPSLREVDAADLNRARQYFRNAVAEELRDGGYSVVSQATPGTMRITFTLSGLSAPNALPNAVGVLAPIALSVGEVTVEGAFREAVSNRVDAVVINRAAGGRVLNATPWSTWSDIESSFDQWAEGIRESVDEAHGR